MNPTRVWNFWAPHYERLWVQKVSLGPTRAALRAALGGLPAGRLLDMGCGTGQLARELPGWDCTGVDLSPSMIAEARRRNPSARFECSDVMAFTAQPASFDAVVCAHAFPYLPDPSAAMARLSDWVRPGGRLLLAQACTENAYDRIALALVKLTTSRARYLSVDALAGLAEPRLGRPQSVVRINRHPLVPSLRLLVWRKPAEGAA